MTKDIEKTDVLNAVFALVFTGKTSTAQSQALEMNGKIWSKEDLFLVEKDQIREHLNKLEKRKSVEPDGMHHQVLRELGNVIVRPCNVEKVKIIGGMFERDLEESKCHPYLEEGGSRELQASQPHPVS